MSDDELREFLNFKADLARQEDERLRDVLQQQAKEDRKEPLGQVRDEIKALRDSLNGWLMIYLFVFLAGLLMILVAIVESR